MVDGQDAPALSFAPSSSQLVSRTRSYAVTCFFVYYQFLKDLKVPLQSILVHVGSNCETERIFYVIIS